jgi:hypothetical protein
MKKLLLFFVLAAGLSVVSAHGPTLPPDPWCPNDPSCYDPPPFPPCEGTLSDPCAAGRRLPVPPRAPRPQPHR